MAKIDQLIRQAQDALNKAKDDEKPLAQAKLDALNEVKAAKIEMDNEEVNGLLTRKVSEEGDKWKGVVGMSREEFEQVMAGVEESLGDQGGGGAEAGDGSEGDNVLERMQSGLQERDQAIKDEREARLKFERELRTERITNRLNDQLKGLGLNEKYENPARRLIGYEDLIEKAMSGEEVTDEELKAKAEAAKAEAPVFFEAEQNTDWQGIPPSPEGTQGPEQITDEQRRQLSDPIF